MNNWSLDWPAPAKLNLVLKILNRREDGFHNIQTVFQFIDNYDFLDFRCRDDSKIARAKNIEGIPEEEDLSVKAAALLQEKMGITKGIEISLTKHLPKGAGLGGGSSDAATTLVALNHLWECKLTSQELLELGLTIGSDVPAFINGLPVWAEGRGENFENIKLPELWFVVLIPDCEVNTAEIFNDPELTRDSSRITIRDFVAGDDGNDCEFIVRKHYPQVAKVFETLNKYSKARLTGTGSCIFSEFETEQEAREVLGLLPEWIKGFVTKGVNESPLINRLAREIEQPK